MPQLSTDHATLEAFQDFVGAEKTHISGHGRQFVVIKQPNFPHFRFEWHPGVKKLYLVRLGHMETIDGEKVFVPLPTNQHCRAERVGEHVLSEGEAYNYVQAFLRGYREGQTPNLTKIHLLEG